MGMFKVVDGGSHVALLGDRSLITGKGGGGNKTVGGGASEVSPLKGGVREKF